MIMADKGGLDFMSRLWDWFDEEIGEVYELPMIRNAPGRFGLWEGPSEGGLVMACPIWGKKYVERFGRYCLPTICAPRNLAALKGRARIVVFCDGKSRRRLLEMLQPLELHGIEIIIREIPPSIMENMGHLYWLLAACQHVAVQMCRRWGMDLHMLQPDHSYSEGYFENLERIRRQGVEAIAQTGVSADIATAAEEIEKYRNDDDELVIPDRDLGDIGYRHLHKQMKMYCMNKAKIPDRMPNSHYMFWQARDKLMIYCCHMNPAMISAKLCAMVPVPKSPGAMASTLDTRLPFICIGGVYIPGVDDGMTFIELSDDSKPAVPDFVDGFKFIQTAWRQVFFIEAFMPYFREVCEVPIHPQNEFIDEEEVIAQHEQVIEMLISRKGDAAIASWVAMSGVEAEIR